MKAVRSKDKVAQHRLNVLQLAETLGCVSEACRQYGMTRTQFYEYKRRFQTQGFEGLKDLPPIHKTHPQTTPPEVIDQILALALKHPTKGCKYLSELLKLDGPSVSGPTVQCILDNHGMGSRVERLLKLEIKHLQDGLELTAKQAAAIEKANPAFRERHLESSMPGELLSTDTFFVGQLKAIGKVYLHAVVDTFGSYGFGFLHTNKQPEATLALLHNDVLPFYAARGLTVGAVLTGNGREFSEPHDSRCELFLTLNDAAHYQPRGRNLRTNGFVERFRQTVINEFFFTALRTTCYETLDVLQTDLDRWLLFYNTERPHKGYRNLGLCPIDTVDQFVTPVTKEG